MTDPVSARTTGPPRLGGAGPTVVQLPDGQIWKHASMPVLLPPVFPAHQYFPYAAKTSLYDAYSRLTYFLMG